MDIIRTDNQHERTMHVESQMISIGTRGDSDLESTSKVAHLLDSTPLPRIPSFLTSSRTQRSRRRRRGCRGETVIFTMPTRNASSKMQLNWLLRSDDSACSVRREAAPVDGRCAECRSYTSECKDGFARLHAQDSYRIGSHSLRPWPRRSAPCAESP